MGSAVRFRSNSPNVVHEVFDDEVVVVSAVKSRRKVGVSSAGAT